MGVSIVMRVPQVSWMVYKKNPNLKWMMVPGVPPFMATLQGGAPPVISWFIIPISLVRYNPHSSTLVKKY